MTETDETPLPASGVLSPQGGQNVFDLPHRYYSKRIKTYARKLRQRLTAQEIKIWQCLRKEQLGVKFRRQFPIDNKYIADFVCLDKKLIIEIDGSQHSDNSYDKERTVYLEDNGFIVLRLWNNEVDQNLNGCIEFIKNLL